MTSESATPRRLRLGMVGGGRDAFIGGVHRIAARLDDHYELVAGCFSSSADKSKASAADLRVADDRAYGGFEAMAKAEAARADGIDVVAIVTPNHMHFPAAKAFLEAGIHVICDKPLTTTLDDALALRDAVRQSGKVFVLTHNYTAYPLIRQARAMVAAGELGAIRVIQAEYPQDWLSTRLEATGQKQAGWRTDPARSGPAGCTGDIGTHAYNLACFVTSARGTELYADLRSFVDGRPLDDNAQMLVRYDNGASGMLWASQVAVGNENALRLRVYGDKAGLAWAQENPNELWLTPLGEPPRRITRAGAGASEAANALSRIPAGHPEGYLEGFANLYSEAAALIRAADAGTPLKGSLLPDIEVGVDGVRFITAAVASSKAGAWVPLQGPYPKV
ncbi:MAG: Gfo/Idh/MocA family protein [Geminicoccaceae bacterium]